MFQVFRPESNLRTDGGVITLIVKLCFQLGLQMPLYVYGIVDKEDGYAYVGLTPADPGETPDFHATRLRRIVERFVRAAQSKIQTKFLNVLKFPNLQTNLDDEDSEGFLRSHLSVLNALSPNVNFLQWKSYLLENFISWAGKIQGASKDLHVQLMGPVKVGKLLQLYALPKHHFSALA